MLSPHSSGTIVSVWVVPGASRDEVVGEFDGALKVRTTAPPEGGKANKRVAELVAAAVGGRRGRVVAGHKARRKVVLVERITPDEARAWLSGGGDPDG